MEVLERKLSIFTESTNGPDDPEVTTSWRAICYLEAQYVFNQRFLVTSIHAFRHSSRELKTESYGVDLLHVLHYCVTIPLLLTSILKAIGFVYVSKAKHHLATHQTFFGVGGWLHNVQGKYHVFSETYALDTGTSIDTDFPVVGFQPYDLRWN